MAPRIVSLMLSAWILVSASALPRPSLQVWAVATTGLSCVVAGLLAFVVEEARLANAVNGALLCGLAIFFPSPSAVVVQHDIIIPGLLLVLSGVPSRLPARPPQPTPGVAPGNPGHRLS